MRRDRGRPSRGFAAVLILVVLGCAVWVASIVVLQSRVEGHRKVNFSEQEPKVVEGTGIGIPTTPEPSTPAPTAAPAPPPPAFFPQHLQSLIGTASDHPQNCTVLFPHGAYNGPAPVRTPAANPQVIPCPLDAKGGANGEEFVLSQDTWLFVGRETFPEAEVEKGTPADLLTYAASSFLCLFGVRFQERAAVLSSTEREEGNRVTVEYLQGEPLGADVHVVDVSRSCVAIRVTSAAALLHALHSLLQVSLASLPPALHSFLPSSLGIAFPVGLSLHDRPRHSWRGLHFDLARHFFPLPLLKELVVTISHYKLNVLHLHLSDDQGWRVEVAGKPELTEVGGRRGASVNRRHPSEEDGSGMGSDERVRALLRQRMAVLRRHDGEQSSGSMRRLLNLKSFRLKRERTQKVHLSGGTAGTQTPVPGTPRPNPPSEPLLYSGTPYDIPAYLTREEARELADFASWFGVEVVPEVDVPAHSAALLRSLEAKLGPEAGAYGLVELQEGCREGSEQDRVLPPNCFGGTHGILYPTPDVLTYVTDIFTDLADTFPGRYMHMGGDEAAAFRNKAYRAEQGRVGSLYPELGRRPSPEAMQAFFAGRVADHIASLGRVPVAWDETLLSLPRLLRASPTPLVGMWWRDWAREASAEAVSRRHGNWSVVLTPVSRAYLDQFQVEPHEDSEYHVQHSTVSLRSVYSLGSLDVRNTLGVQACLWTETLHTWPAVQYQLLPRLLALSEAAWTTRDHLNFTSFLVRLQTHKSSLAARGFPLYQGHYVG